MNLLVMTTNFGLKYAIKELKELLEKESRVLGENLLIVESEDFVRDFLAIVILSKTAKRTLIELISSPIEDISNLYEISKSVSWDTYMTPNQSFAVRAIDLGFLSQPEFPKKEIERIVGQGIVDNFIEKMGKRPPVNLNNPDLEIYAFVRDNEVFLGLDISGYDLNSDEEILARSLVIESSGDYNKEVFIEVLSGGLSQSAWDYAKRIPYRGRAAKLSFIKTRLLDRVKFLNTLKEEWGRTIKPQVLCFERDEKIDLIKKSFIDYKLIQIKSLDEFEVQNGVVGSNLIVAEPRKDAEIRILEKVIEELKKAPNWRKAVFSVRLDVIDIFKKFFENDIEKESHVENEGKIRVIYGSNVKIKGIEGKIVSLVGVD